MGRIAGVTAEETRDRLLATAAAVFGRLGYEKASIAQISSEAGLSSGAIYAHYRGKADLFVATLRAHGEREFERLLGSGGIDFSSFLTARGQTLDRRGTAPRTLLIEAIVAAKHDPEVADVLVASFADREARLVTLMEAAQQAGDIDAGLPARAAVRFALMVALGSVLVAAMGLPPTDHDDWVALISGLIDSVRGRTEKETS